MNSEPSRISTMKLFVKVVNDFKPSTIFAKKTPLPMFDWVRDTPLGIFATTKLKIPEISAGF